MLGVTEFGTLDEAWHFAARELHRDGAQVAGRNGGTVELLSQHFRLTDPEQSWLHSRVRKAAHVYSAAELLWYLSGSNDGAVMTAYSEKYGAFLNGGKANGAYGKRWSDYGQLRSVARILREKPSSRQAIVASWHPCDVQDAVRGDKNDIPCTLTIQYLARDGRLHCIVSMRSNDWWLGMPYDVWCFCQIQRIMAAVSGLRLGWYEHHVGSLHAYDENKAGLWAAAEVTSWSTPDPPALQVSHLRSWDDVMEDVAVAVAEETRIRTNAGGPRMVRPEVIELLGGPDTLLSHLVKACARKFSK